MVIIEKPSLQLLNGNIKQFLLGFVITIVYIPGILGASIPTGWLFLIIISPLLVIPTTIPLFLIYAIISLLWTVNDWIGFFFLLQFIALWLVFEFGKTIKDLRPIFKRIALGLGINSIIALSQYYGFHQVFTLDNTSAGLFLNPNIYSEISALVLVALIWLRLWYWIPLTLTGLILVHSRAAILSLIICSLLYLYKRFPLYTSIGTVLISITGIIFLIFGMIYYPHISAITSIQERFDLWADTLRGIKIFGNGVGSYEILYPYYSTHVDTSLFRPRYAHNDLLQLIFDFGIGTLLLLPVIYKAAKSVNPILYSFGVVSLLAFPLHVPLSAFIVCLVTGFIVSNNDTVRNSRNSCRSILSKRNKE